MLAANMAQAGSKLSGREAAVYSFCLLVIGVLVIGSIDWGVDIDLLFSQIDWSFAVRWTLLVLLYPLPLVIAHRRHHRNLPALAVINLGLGWTVVGWVCALAWSLYRERQ